jgi:iron complex transport system substrate-binding protein
VRQGPRIRKSRLIWYLRMGVSLQVLVIIQLLSWPASSQAAVFHDSLGRKVEVGLSPKRIVSLAPSITEMIYYLGLKERLVGVTRFSSFPEEARHKPKVGTYTNINVEKAIALDPELAIGTVDGNRREDVEMLEEAGIPVYVVNPRNVHQILETIEAIGEICGVPDRARDLVRSLRQRVARVTGAVRSRQRPLVFLIINTRQGINPSPTRDSI